MSPDYASNMSLLLYDSLLLWRLTSREENTVLVDTQRVDDSFMSREVEDKCALGTLPLFNAR